ncbi:MAG: RecX family transcriptional regulator [Chloroflexi bacterium]|nr:RecX family transcriptional regulator [Chloroflexota bacterium]
MSQSREGLAEGEAFRRAWEVARRFLRYRPRSEAEVRRRLARDTFPPPVVSLVIEGLQEGRLIDDIAFARLWRENRESFNPRSRRLLAWEMAAKGIPPSVIEDACHDLDDEVSAYRAATKRVLRLPEKEDYAVFMTRLSPYLRRRGFDYGVIEAVLQRLWQERRLASGPTEEETSLEE